MYVDAVGTLPPVGMIMLSVQMIPPLVGSAHFRFGFDESSWKMSPDHAIAAARSPCDSGWAESFPVKRRIWPESTAFWIRSTAAFHDASVTLEGSSPLSSITSPGVSPMPFSAVTLPLSFGSSNSCVIEVMGPVSFSFQAIPVMPDCHGREYLRSGSNGGLACASIRLEKL